MNPREPKLRSPPLRLTVLVPLIDRKVPTLTVPPILIFSEPCPALICREGVVQVEPWPWTVTLALLMALNALMNAMVLGPVLMTLPPF